MAVDREFRENSGGLARGRRGSVREDSGGQVGRGGLVRAGQVLCTLFAYPVHYICSLCALYLQALRIIFSGLVHYTLYLQALCNVFAGLVQHVCQPCSVYLQTQGPCPMYLQALCSVFAGLVHNIRRP